MDMQPAHRERNKWLHNSNCILYVFKAVCQLVCIEYCPFTPSAEFLISNLHHLPIKISGSNARIAQKRCAFPSSLQSRPLVHFASERALEVQNWNLLSDLWPNFHARAHNKETNCAARAAHFTRTHLTFKRRSWTCVVTIIYSPRALKQKNSSRG